jgi:hypothetical protein
MLSISLRFILLFAFLLEACSTNARLGSENSNRSNKDLLQGEWWLDPTDTQALFKIHGDSLYYTDQPDHPFLVRIAGEIIVFSQDGIDTRFTLVKLTKDTLAYRDFGLDEIVYFTKGE